MIFYQKFCWLWGSAVPHRNSLLFTSDSERLTLCFLFCSLLGIRIASGQTTSSISTKLGLPEFQKEGLTCVFSWEKFWKFDKNHDFLLNWVDFWDRLCCVEIHGLCYSSLTRSMKYTMDLRTTACQQSYRRPIKSRTQSQDSHEKQFWRQKYRTLVGAIDPPARLSSGALST